MVRGSRHPEHLESVLTLCVTLGPSFYLSESKLSREDPLRGQRLGKLAAFFLKHLAHQQRPSGYFRRIT